jgi:acyl-CoA synthetase (AMP-forming)/AMP-acid ligase II
MYNEQKILDVIVQKKTSNPKFLILSDSTGNYSWQQLFTLAEMHKAQFSDKEQFLVFYSDKSVHSVAVILACLMQKKTFIPVSREQPVERLKSILSALKHETIYDPGIGTFLDFSLDNCADHEANHCQLMENTFYVLFTSGSTGTPKGVQISEANIANTLKWGTKYFSWNDNDVIGIVTSFHFDISLFDLFIGLTKGIRMHIFFQTFNPNEFIKEVCEFSVTSIFSTPSLYGQIVRLNDPTLIRTSNLRRIISGGDFFLPSDIVYWYLNFPHIEMYNVWGPTETTIVNTAHKITVGDIERLHSQKSVSIGQSSREMHIIICEPDTYPIKQLTRSQEIGELVVVGDSVGLGYLDTKSEAQKNFTAFNGKRAYRTGDLGFIEDSKIYMVGRNANFIKYQGFRVDPREVESHLIGKLGIRNCCLVLAKNANQSFNLVLLVELSSNSSCTVIQVKDYLRDKLPSYMIPKYIKFLENLPLNSNGKIDRESCAKLAHIKDEK